MGLKITKSIDEKLEGEEEKDFKNKQLRSLIGNEIYCPKCGTENYFEPSKDKMITEHHCKKCKVNLSIFWDTHQDGFMPIEHCEACEELTFKDLKHCISCGLTKAVIKRLDEIESGKYKPKRHKWFITKKLML